MIPSPPIRLLFISNLGILSQMAHGLARSLTAPPLVLTHACVQERYNEPLARDILAEIGIDTSDLQTSSLDALLAKEFDILISLGESTFPIPTLPGNPSRLHWTLSVPSTTAETPAIRAIAWRPVRDQIQTLVRDFVQQGYLRALGECKHRTDLILENLNEGIVAHDQQRRIFYFNQAAETLTGFNRNEVLGRDCHSVFANGFCGSLCLYREPIADLEPPKIVRQTLDITTRQGEIRRVNMTINPLRDGHGQLLGRLATLEDRTQEWNTQQTLKEPGQFAGIVGRDSRMVEIFDLIRDVAKSDVSVLVQGESGTGKELVAAAIHRESGRANRLFVPINCGALPETLLESELFGHVRGAFTGAIRDKKGRFELAHGSTIFLDEIGDISPAMQVKLLRVLQEGTFERVGSEKTVHVDVRVISATNKDLLHEIEEGRFREDLYYRLCVVPINIPPLRERRTDIPLIAEYCLQRALAERERADIQLAPRTLDLMIEYDWPGNIRELQNWIQFALVKCKGDTIEPEHLPLQRPPRVSQPPVTPLLGKRRKLTLADVREALSKTRGNKLAAAHLLGVSRATLYRFLDELAEE
jgi:PAS domain S-box-containing protein